MNLKDAVELARYARSKEPKADVPAEALIALLEFAERVATGNAVDREWAGVLMLDILQSEARAAELGKEPQ